MAGNSRTISQQYKASKLTFNVTGLTNVNDSTITVSGDNTDTYTLKHGESALVPHDTQISISVNDMDGYSTPSFENSIYNSDSTIEVAYSEVSMGSMYILYGEGQMPLYAKSIDDIKASGSLGDVMDGVFGVGFMSPDFTTNYFIPIGHGAQKILDYVSNSGYICEMHHVEPGYGTSINISGLQSIDDATTGEYNTNLINTTYGSQTWLYDEMFLDVEESILAAAGTSVTGIPAVSYVKEVEKRVSSLFGGIYTKSTFHIPSVLEIMSFFNNYADYEYIGNLVGNYLDLKNGLPTGFRCNWGGSEKVLSDTTITYATSYITKSDTTMVLWHTDGWNDYQPEVAVQTGVPGWVIPMFSVDFSSYGPF